MASSVAPFRLLDLPLEIRRQIYREVVCTPDLTDHPDPLHFARVFGTSRGQYPTFRDMSLLRVSRQVNIEAASELYGRTKFEFLEAPYDSFSFNYDLDDAEIALPCHLLSLVPFLESIGNNNRKFLRSLHIKLGGQNRSLRIHFWEAVELLAPIKTSLTITIDCQTMRGYALGYFEDLAEDLQDGKINCHTKTFALLQGIKCFILQRPTDENFMERWNPESSLADSDNMIEYLKKWVEKKPSIPMKGEPHKVAQKLIGTLQEKLTKREELVKKSAAAALQLRKLNERIGKVDDELEKLTSRQ